MMTGKKTLLYLFICAQLLLTGPGWSQDGPDTGTQAGDTKPSLVLTPDHHDFGYDDFSKFFSSLTKDNKTNLAVELSSTPLFNSGQVFLDTLAAIMSSQRSMDAHKNITANFLLDKILDELKHPEKTNHQLLRTIDNLRFSEALPPLLKFSYNVKSWTKEDIVRPENKERLLSLNEILHRNKIRPGLGAVVYLTKQHYLQTDADSIKFLRETISDKNRLMIFTVELLQSSIALSGDFEMLYDDGFKNFYLTMESIDRVSFLSHPASMIFLLEQNRILALVNYPEKLTAKWRSLVSDYFRVNSNPINPNEWASQYNLDAKDFTHLLKMNIDNFSMIDSIFGSENRNVLLKNIEALLPLANLEPYIAKNLSFVEMFMTASPENAALRRKIANYKAKTSFRNACRWMMKQLN